MIIPDNLCILPFIHLSTKPPGQARYCCFSPKHIILDDDENEFKLDTEINKIWNSNHAKDFRKQFLNNEKPDACICCWREESSGKKSKRIKERENYLSKYKYKVDFANNNNGRCPPPIYLDLRLGNKCNLKCRSCNSISSSLIEKEVKTWDDSYFAKKEQFKAKVDINDWYRAKQFSKNMENLIPFLEQVYVTGGEPSIIPELTKFLKKCIELKRSKDIFLRINTNLASYNKEFFETLKEFKYVDLGPSVDAIGSKLTYLRHPLQWFVFIKNFEKILSLPDNIGISVNCTVSVYNLLYLEELYFAIYDIAGSRPINFIFEIAHDPDYLNFNILSKDLKEEAERRILNLIRTATLTEHQINDLLSIRTMLYIPVDLFEEKRKRFREHVNYIDSIRDESFSKTFPELKEMLYE